MNEKLKEIEATDAGFKGDSNEIWERAYAEVSGLPFDATPSAAKKRCMTETERLSRKLDQARQVIASLLNELSLNRTSEGEGMLGYFSEGGYDPDFVLRITKIKKEQRRKAENGIEQHQAVRQATFRR